MKFLPLIILIIAGNVDAGLFDWKKKLVEYKETKKCFEIGTSEDPVSIEELLRYVQHFNNKKILGKAEGCHNGVEDSFYEGIEFGCDKYKPEVSHDLHKDTGIGVPIPFKYQVGLPKKGSCVIEGEEPNRRIQSANLVVKYSPSALGYPKGNLVWRFERGKAPNELCIFEYAKVRVRKFERIGGQKIQAMFEKIKGGKHTHEESFTDFEIAQMKRNSDEWLKAQRVRARVNRFYSVTETDPVDVNLPFYAGHADLIDTLIEDVGRQYESIRKDPALRSEMISNAKPFSNKECVNDEYDNFLHKHRASGNGNSQSGSR